MLYRIVVLWLAMAAVPAVPSPAQEGVCNGKNALIYYGAVADQDSALELAWIFENELGCPVEYFCRMDQLPELLGNATILVIGGTGEDLSPVYDELDSDSTLLGAIQTHLKGGVRYLGICGGAFLGSKKYKEWDGDILDWDWLYAFGLIQVKTEWYDDEYHGAQLVDILWQGEEKPLGTFYQAGPMFTPLEKDIPGWKVLATYPVRKKNEPAPAAVVMADYGDHGRVLLLGPHPEASEAWLGPNGLCHCDWQDTSGLLVQAIRELMKPR